ncbi:MAG: hypothetical protein ABIK96_17155 [bacterium]
MPNKGAGTHPWKWVAAVLLLGLGAAGASAVPAPLDTLTTTAAGTEQASSQPGGGFSRTLLPVAKASTVPAAGSPQRPPRLDDPMAGALNYQRARKAALEGNTLEALESMGSALEADPGQPGYYWWQGVQALKVFDARTFFRSLPASLQALLHNPVAQGQTLISLQAAGILATAIFWTVLVLGFYLARWRYLAHDAAALLFRNRAHPPLLLLPLLLPFLTLALRPGWLGFLAIVSLPLVIKAAGRGRWLLLGAWLVALVLVFPSWPVLRQAVPTLDPDSEVMLLDSACRMPPSPLITAELERRLDEATDQTRRNRLNVALAIQEARRGQYQESSRLFEEVLANDPANLAAGVGLGNNTYFRGRLDAAVSIYQRTMEHHPRSGEVHYNLAQVYFKKLFVPEATEAMEMARQSGFDPGEAAERQAAAGYSPVVYPPLTAGEFRAACRAEAANYPLEITFASWRPLLGAPPLPLYAVVGGPLVIALLFMMGRGGQKDRKECENCGIPLCRTCCKVRDGAWMCAQCGEIAQRAQSDMILATLLKNRSRSEGMAYSQRIVRLGRILPGAGHLSSSRLVAAWFRLNLVAGGAFLAVAGWAFDPGAPLDKPSLLLPVEMIHPDLAPLPAALWPGLSHPAVIGGIALLTLAWALALWDGSNLRRGIPDRYSLIPMTAHKETEYEIGAPAR